MINGATRNIVSASRLANDEEWFRPRVKAGNEFPGYEAQLHRRAAHPSNNTDDCGRVVSIA